MASPQVENGYAPISQELLQAIARARLRASTRAVLDCVVAQTYGWGRKVAPISLEFFVEWTSFSTSTVQRALRELYDRKIVLAQNNRPVLYKVQKDYDQWLTGQQVTKSKKKVTGQDVTTLVGHDDDHLSRSTGDQQDTPQVEGTQPTTEPLIQEYKNTNTSTTNSKKARKPRKAKETWLTPFNDIWLGKFGGDMPFGVAAAVLKRLVDRHGHDTTIAHFTAFVDHAEPDYVSLPRFESTFGSWKPRKEPKNPEAQRIARLQRASLVV
jgi:phage replication O-like protein O